MFRIPLLPAVAWSAVIALLMLTPGNYIPRITTFLDWIGPDKLVHIFLFGIYAYVLIEGFRRHGSVFLQRHSVAAAFVVGMVFAIFTEVMQRFVIEGRNGNPFDLAADLLGLILAYAIWRFTRRNDKKNLSISKKYN